MPTPITAPTQLDCIDCRELSRDLSPMVASTIPDTDLCSHCLAKQLGDDLDQLADLLTGIRKAVDAGRDTLPDALLDKAGRVLREAFATRPVDDVEQARRDRYNATVGRGWEV